MNLILKIAGGVFLGIVAAFGAYMAFNTWESQAIAKRLEEQNRKRVEQELSEARVQRARTTKAAYSLSSLKLDKLFALCGPPLDDKMQGLSSIRHIYYTGADGHKVALQFTDNKSKHYLFYDDAMTQADVTQYDSPKDYETYVDPPRTDNDRLHESQIAELPCLIGLAEGYK